ncbi:MAG: trigger factor [Methyloligellaceae bacterium]
MEITETTSDGLKRELKVKIAASELNDRLSKRLDELKTQVNLKGFRPGKVPVDHLRKVYGRSVMAEILEQTISESTQKAIADRKERPAFDPDISVTEDSEEIEKVIAGNSDLDYTISFEVLPEIEISDLTKLKLEKPVVDVTKKEVDEGLQRIHEDAVTYKKKDGKAKEGDQVTIDYEGKIDGKAFDGGQANDAPVVLGKGTFIPGFEEGLTGVKAGDKKTIDCAFPDEYLAKELAGKKAKFDVTVKQVAAPELAKLDDEFAKKLGFDTLAGLRDAVEARIKEEYGTASRNRLKRDLLDDLDKNHKFDVPATLVEREFESVWKQVNEELEKAGRTFEDEDTTEKKARKEYEELAERRVRLGLVLSEIGEKGAIKITDEEVNQALMERVQQFPGQEREVYEFYQKNPEALAELRVPIFENKVVDHILEKASVKDKKVTTEELFKDPEGDDES